MTQSFGSLIDLSHTIEDGLITYKGLPASILLRHNILIVEHMTNLRQLPAADFRFFAVPVKVKGMGTFPVRAFGIV